MVFSPTSVQFKNEINARAPDSSSFFPRSEQSASPVLHPPLGISWALPFAMDTAESYAFTPALRRKVIIGHQFVKAD